MKTLQTALAYKVLKGDKKVEATPQNSPKTLGESVFAKPFTWLIIAGVVAYFGNKLLKKLVQAKPIEEVKGDVDKLRKTQVPSYTDGQYNQFAQVLYLAMKGFGTDEDAVYRIMGYMKKDIDVAKLIVAFGVKDDDTLAAWLQDDLSTDEITKVNSILNSKGITYKF